MAIECPEVLLKFTLTLWQRLDAMRFDGAQNCTKLFIRTFSGALIRLSPVDVWRNFGTDFTELLNFKPASTFPPFCARKPACDTGQFKTRSSGHVKTGFIFYSFLFTLPIRQWRMQSSTWLEGWRARSARWTQSHWAGHTNFSTGFVCQLRSDSFEEFSRRAILWCEAG